MFRAILAFAAGFAAAKWGSKENFDTFRKSVMEGSEKFTDMAKETAEKLRNVAQKSRTAVKEEFFKKDDHQADNTP